MQEPSGEDNQLVLWLRSRRDRTVEQAQEAIERFRDCGKPEAQALTEHLRHYRLGEAGLRQTAAVGAGTTGGRAAAENGPGLLRIAMSAAKSLAKFLGSSCKLVPLEVHTSRVGTCGGCEHYTGLRCRLCGCCTQDNAWVRSHRP